MGKLQRRRLFNPSGLIMKAEVHPTAVLLGDVEVKEGVKIGPYTIIDGEKGKVVIGEGTVVYGHVWIQGPTFLGEDNRIYPYVSIGGGPQDIGYKEEPTEIYIGDRNVIREYTTINKGSTKDKGKTVIGNDNYFMAYSHIAHDCKIGNNIVFTNGASVAGHAEVHDYAILSAFVGVQQFCRIGAHSFVGAYSAVTQDVLPYAKVVGIRPLRVVGVNTVGLSRRGFTRDQIRSIDRAFRLLLRSGLLLKEAISEIEKELGDREEIKVILDFLKTLDPRRGFHRKFGNSG